MKLIVTILLIGISLTTFGQYKVQWDMWFQDGINYYEIQESGDKINWSTLQTIPKGSSLDYTDNISCKQNYYYRIAAITTDTTFYSKIIQTFTSNGKRLAASSVQETKKIEVPEATSIKVFPGFIIDVESPVVQELLCRYFDMTGRLLNNKKFNVTTGDNLIYMNDNASAHGIYILWFKTKSGVIVKKIVK